jgi:deoxyribose-phosphate aldolase
MPEPRSGAELAPLIDHTLLRADATPAEVTRLAEEARAYGFAAVCVNSSMVAVAARVLEGSKTLPIAVVGFPLGAGLTSAKAFEAREAIAAGAREIDMVLHLGLLNARDYPGVRADIEAVVEASRPYPVKVILETHLLDLEQKTVACELAKAAGAAFVKTSTGFSGGGATVEDVALMRKTVGVSMGVKASGGIRTTDDALKMVQAGANRIGASASVAIVTGAIPGAGGPQGRY